MPEELQLLGEGKKREPEASIQCALLESLIMLCSTRWGRDYLRAKKVYPIIRELHLAVTETAVHILAEKLVNLIMRDEPKIEEVEGLHEDEASPDDDREAVPESDDEIDIRII